jgi:hypothetical protein
MPYVQRANGKIVGVYAQRQPGYAEEWLADDDAEVLAYLNPPPPPPDNYKPMIRRRADKLMRAGDVAGALLTLKQIGE